MSKTSKQNGQATAEQMTLDVSQIVLKLLAKIKDQRRALAQAEARAAQADEHAALLMIRLNVRRNAPTMTDPAGPYYAEVLAVEDRVMANASLHLRTVPGPHSAAPLARPPCAGDCGQAPGGHCVTCC